MRVLRNVTTGKPVVTLRVGARGLAHESGQSLAQVAADRDKCPPGDKFVMAVSLPTVLRWTRNRRRTSNRGIDPQVPMCGRLVGAPSVTLTTASALVRYHSNFRGPRGRG